MRAFIAIDIPRHVKSELICVQKQLVEQGMRLVPPESFHITLKFLGEVTEESLQTIIKSLQTVQFSPFDIQIENVGVFPNVEHCRVIWVGVTCPHIGALIEQIQRSLYAFPIDEIHPHVTLARVEDAPRTTIKNFLQKNKDWKLEPFRVEKFVLKQSVLQQTGSVYRDIQSFPAVDLK